MPRIAAPTVKEHRAAQRQRLLAVAQQVLEELGPAGLGFGELSKRSGLARPTIYEYFATRDDLLVALLNEQFDAWETRLARTVARAPSAETKVQAYILAHLRLVKQGRHGLPALFESAAISVQVQAVVSKRHRQIFAHLMPALAELAPAEPSLCVEMLRGCLKAAMDQVAEGGAPRRLARQVSVFLIGGMRALGSTT